MARVRIYYSRARRESSEEAADFVRARLREIQFRARINASHGPYTTGNLARSIERRGPFFDFGRVNGSVGSNLVYANAVESGAVPHVIRPVNKKALRFYWRKVGHWVIFDQVNHPGQRGKGYLLEAAKSVARTHNMLLIIHEL